MTFHAWAALSPHAALQRFDYEPEPLQDDQLEILVSHCGICHSDVHLVDGDWGDVFPVVPGHEIIGSIVGGGGLRHGTRVGVGWQRDSCGECRYCREGEEELCAESQATCMGHFGGYADRIRVSTRFAFPIPETLPSETAAPLLCGGITVWSPLRRFAGAGSRVGVIGIGGLGHLAVQLAAALGCEVEAFSRSADKEEDARRFGAHGFSVGKPARGSLDLVINTAPHTPDMDEFLKALRPKGVFCQVGATSQPLSVQGGRLIGGRHTVTGSAIGSPGAIRELLDFAATHGVRAVTEVTSMADANAALDRTRRYLARYRMVLAAEP